MGTDTMGADTGAEMVADRPPRPLPSFAPA